MMTPLDMIPSMQLCILVYIQHVFTQRKLQLSEFMCINPLRTVATYMRHGGNNIATHKQIAVTPPLFNLYASNEAHLKFLSKSGKIAVHLFKNTVLFVVHH